MSFRTPNQYRERTHRTYGTGDDARGHGSFTVPTPDGVLLVIADDGLASPEPHQWEHVSVHFADADGKQRTPTWDEMCLIKTLFWDAEDTVIQLHPPRSSYVNKHPHVLHLWRAVNWRQPLPLRIQV